MVRGGKREGNGRRDGMSVANMLSMAVTDLLLRLGIAGRLD